MRKALLKVFILSSILLFPGRVVNGQNVHKLSGTVMDCKYKIPLKNVILKLVCQNGNIFSAISDSSGSYFFNDSVLIPDMEYVLSVNAPDPEKRIPYGTCPFSYYNNGYLNSSEKAKFKAAHDLSSVISIHDFCLVPLEREIRIPTIFFKNNSTDFETKNDHYYEYDNGGDTITDCFADLCKNFPQFVIEISGHADKKEKNTKELANARAKKVYDLLIEKGIDKERLVYKGYGADRPVYIDARYMQLPAGEKVNNKRVDIVVLSKNYKTDSK